MRALTWLAAILGLLTFFVGVPVALAYTEENMPLAWLAIGIVTILVCAGIAVAGRDN